VRKPPAAPEVARVEYPHVFIWALLECFDGRFDVAFLKARLSRICGSRTVGYLKVTLLIIENCGIYWCSQRAALYDPHCLRSASLGCASLM